jgi:hypothetical protein
MQYLLDGIRTSKQIAAVIVATLALVLGMTLAAIPARSASAAVQEHCRVFTPQFAGTEAGQRYTKHLFVPGASVSDCDDINIRNVQNTTVAGDNCATFKVQFFPTWRTPYYGEPKTVCSKGPNGTVVPIATNVLTGTDYRVWSTVGHTYQIVD